MLIESGPFKRSRGWIKRDVTFSSGYEGRLCEKPPGLRYGRIRGSKTTARKKRSKPAWGGYVPYVIRPGW